MAGSGDINNKIPLAYRILRKEVPETCGRLPKENRNTYMIQ
jgi:hypothetical protein